MRCLFTHKWKTFVPRLWDTTFTSALAYRTCKRCGTTQFGMPKGPDQVIAWETMREHSFVRRMRYGPSAGPLPGSANWPIRWACVEAESAIAEDPENIRRSLKVSCG